MYHRFTTDILSIIDNVNQSICVCWYFINFNCSSRRCSKNGTCLITLELNNISMPFSVGSCSFERSTRWKRKFLKKKLFLRVLCPLFYFKTFLVQNSPTLTPTHLKIFVWASFLMVNKTAKKISEFENFQ